MTLKELNDEAVAVATSVWGDTYRQHPGDDSYAMKYLTNLLEESRGQDDSEELDELHLERLFFTLAWVDCGRPTLETSHKYAAALMLTPNRDDISEDLHLPWRAFRVHVPPGLLDCGDIEFTQVDVMLQAENEVAGMMKLSGTRQPNQSVVHVTRVAKTVADLFFSPEDQEMEWAPPTILAGLREQEEQDKELKERCSLLARRLVTGLLYTMQHTTHFKERVYGSKHAGTKRDGPPPHRVIFCGRPMSLDCRPMIRKWLGTESKTAPPSVQTLVRGHYKRQVIGMARSGRKIIWVEPYWRGPEDAPILARPYKVGPQN
jgi:hypothetical protein